MRKKWPTSGSLPSSSTRKITAAPCNRWRGVAGAAVVELAHGVAAGAVAARVAAAAANRGGGAAGVKLNVGTRRATLSIFSYVFRRDGRGGVQKFPGPDKKFQF